MTEVRIRGEDGVEEVSAKKVLVVTVGASGEVDVLRTGFHDAELTVVLREILGCCEWRDGTQLN